MSGLILRQREFNQQAADLRILPLHGAFEVLDGRIPLPLVELRLAEIEIAVGIRWVELDHSLEVPVGNLPLIVLCRNNAQDHVPVECGRIALERALGKLARTLEVALAERFIGLLQQAWGLGGEAGSDRHQEEETDHVTVT